MSIEQVMSRIKARNAEAPWERESMCRCDCADAEIGRLTAEIDTLKSLNETLGKDLIRTAKERDLAVSEREVAREARYAAEDQVERLRALMIEAKDELERISMPEDDVDGLIGRIGAAIGHQQLGEKR